MSDQTAEDVYAQLCGECAYRLVDWDDQPSLDDIETAGDGKCGACGAVGQVFDIPAHDDRRRDEKGR